MPASLQLYRTRSGLLLNAGIRFHDPRCQATFLWALINNEASAISTLVGVGSNMPSIMHRLCSRSCSLIQLQTRIKSGLLALPYAVLS